MGWKAWKQRGLIGRSGLWAVCALLFASCAAKTNSVTNQCVVNSDQTGTFIGHWTSRPIPLGVIATDFDATELNAIRAAISTWNDFFKVSKGFSLYLSGSSNLGLLSGSTPRLTSGTVCSDAAVGGGGFLRPIVIQKNTSSWSYGSSVIAMTNTCQVPVSGASYLAMFSGVMEINFVNFFSAGKPVPDLQSVVTHELGHLLGLRHSCNSAASTGWAACSGANPDYISALMFPTLGFDGTRGRLSRDIRTNDQQRANCLY